MTNRSDHVISSVVSDKKLAVIISVDMTEELTMKLLRLT